MPKHHLSPFLLKLSLSSSSSPSSSSSEKTMKHKATVILKQVSAALASVARSSKSAALKNKAAIFKLLRSKKLMLIKLHSLLRSPPATAMLDAAAKAKAREERIDYYGEDQEELFPDWGLSLFDLEQEEEEEQEGEALEVAWAARKGSGEEFDLGEGIDRAADAFIRRFNRQMRLENELVELESSLIDN